MRKKELVISLLLIVLFAAYGGAYAQIVSDNAFLKGNYVEVGLGRGAFYGSKMNAPEGFHPRGESNPNYLGFVADPDKDGWEAGSPGYCGDYFIPGSPEESFAIKYNGITYHNSGATGTELEGAFISHEVASGETKVVWEATATDLKVTQTTTLGDDNLYFLTTITIENTSPGDINNLYWMRNVDPDNDRTLGSGYGTENIIRSQPNVDTNLVFVQATGSSFGCYVAMAMSDARGKAYIGGGLVNSDPEEAYNQTDPDKNYNVDELLIDDQAMGLCAKVNELKSGESTSFTFAYLLSLNDLDKMFEELVETCSDYDITSDDIECSGEGNMGAIYIGCVNPGAAYSIDGVVFQANPNFTGLAAGTYTVYENYDGVTSEIGTITINEPAAITYDITVNDVSCHGANDGSLNVLISGGTSPVEFSIDGGVTFDNNDGPLGPGDYHLVFKDANGCEVDAGIFTVVEPAEIIIGPIDVEQLLCFGDSDGSIELGNVTGGIEPLSYSINGSAYTTNSRYENLTAGVYSVSILDSKGCTVETGDITISSPEELVLTASYEDLLCNLDSNGTINLEVSGGVSPYKFNWEGTDGFVDSINQNLSGLSKGVYNIQVEDANGCLITDSYEIMAPPLLEVYIESPLQESNNFHFNISYHQGSNGEINTDILGGAAGPVTVNWTGPNGFISTDEDLSNLKAGMYTIVVTDANGCVEMDSIELTEPAALQLPQGFSPNNDGIHDTYEVHGLEAYPKNTFLVFNRYGNQVFEASNYYNSWLGVNQSNDELPSGTYFVILKVDNREIAQEDITLKGYVVISR